MRTINSMMIVLPGRAPTPRMQLSGTPAVHNIKPSHVADRGRPKLSGPGTANNLRLGSSFVVSLSSFPAGAFVPLLGHDH